MEMQSRKQLRPAKRAPSDVALADELFCSSHHKLEQSSRRIGYQVVDVQAHACAQKEGRDHYSI